MSKAGSRWASVSLIFGLSILCVYGMDKNNDLRCENRNLHSDVTQRDEELRDRNERIERLEKQESDARSAARSCQLDKTLLETRVSNARFNLQLCRSSLRINSVYTDDLDPDLN